MLEVLLWNVTVKLVQKIILQVQSINHVTPILQIPIKI